MSSQSVAFHLLVGLAWCPGIVEEAVRVEESAVIIQRAWRKAYNESKDRKNVKVSAKSKNKGRKVRLGDERPRKRFKLSETESVTSLMSISASTPTAHEHWLWKSMRSYLTSERAAVAKSILKADSRVLFRFTHILVRKFEQFVVANNTKSHSERLALEWSAVLQHILVPESIVLYWPWLCDAIWKLAIAKKSKAVAALANVCGSIMLNAAVKEEDEKSDALAMLQYNSRRCLWNPKLLEKKNNDGLSPLACLIAACFKTNERAVLKSLIEPSGVHCDCACQGKQRESGRRRRIDTESHAICRCEWGHGCGSHRRGRWE